MNIGIVMPTYNQEKWLEKALDSIAAAQAEFHSNDNSRSRLLVVDDGSTDSTPKILERRDVYVTTHPRNHGTAHAINTGVSFLTGVGAFGGPYDALTWVSSDNEMSPDWLEVLADAMEEHKAGAVYAGFDYVIPTVERRDSAWKDVARYLHIRHEPGLLLASPKNCYYGPAFLIREDVWLAAGPHRGRIAHDYDHWLRVEEACWARSLPIVGVDRSLCRYNAHADRATIVRRDEFDAFRWQAEAKVRRGSK